MPDTSRQAISAFLSLKRIAVVGASRSPKDFNTRLFHDLRGRGYDAVPVNPNAREIDGVPCFESIQEIRPPVEGALVMTKPDAATTVVKDCLEAGVRHVWLYRGAGQGAVTPAAVDFCKKNGIEVVAGYCPYMFLPETQWFHRMHGFFLKIGGSYPS